MSGFDELTARRRRATLLKHYATFPDDAVVILTPTHFGELEIVCANELFARISGTDKNLVVGLSLSQLVGHVFSDPGLEITIQQALHSADMFVGRTMIFDRTTGHRELAVDIYVYRIDRHSLDGSGLDGAIALIYREAPDSLPSRQTQSDSPFFDALTSLPNRSLFMNRLAHVAGRLRRSAETQASILVIGLDRFRRVNQLFGHETGDLLLVAIARRLEHLVRPGDTLARLYADEFAMIVDHAERDAGESVAQRIRDSLDRTFTVGIHDNLSVSASIGIVTLGPQYLSARAADDLVSDAYIAMNRAKASEHTKFVVFEPPFRAEVQRRLQLQDDLRRALDRNELAVAYQPIVATTSGRIVGFEALLRWNHRDLGPISPAEFIPIAEDTGLISRLGAWTFNTVCAQIQEWNSAFPDYAPFKVSLNVSVTQLTAERFSESLLSIARHWQIDPLCLSIEITESILIRDPEHATGVLRELQNAGMQIHIDDFGTGYSSLAYLHTFPVDALKIDRTFVSGIQTGIAQPKIVAAMIDLARRLQLCVIAEGVETPEQALALRNMDCDALQGYLFARALEPAHVPGYLIDNPAHDTSLDRS